MSQQVRSKGQWPKILKREYQLSNSESTSGHNYKITANKNSGRGPKDTEQYPSGYHAFRSGQSSAPLPFPCPDTKSALALSADELRFFVTLYSLPFFVSSGRLAHRGRWLELSRGVAW